MFHDSSSSQCLWVVLGYFFDLPRPYLEDSSKATSKLPKNNIFLTNFARRKEFLLKGIN